MAAFWTHFFLTAMNSRETGRGSYKRAMGAQLPGFNSNFIKCLQGGCVCACVCVERVEGGQPVGFMRKL